MSTELTTIERSFMPALAIEDAVHRFQTLNTFIQKVMKEGTDFGTIPGTDKATLLKPGAEKLTTLFGLSVRFEITKEEEDWIGRDHNNEPFFYYRVRCSLYRGDLLVAEADASCSSWEKKYRYRNADRTCPACGEAAIIKGKQEYGGGWLCWKRKGGCGAKYNDGDQQIESQDAGKIPNPDIADQVNTILKMAEKRALVAAVLIAVNASEYFTQDLEELDVIDVQPAPMQEAPEPPAPRTNGARKNVTPMITKAQKDEILRLGMEKYGSQEHHMAHWLVDFYGHGFEELTHQEAEETITFLREQPEAEQEPAVME